jgi:hypothetical protein
MRPGVFAWVCALLVALGFFLPDAIPELLESNSRGLIVLPLVFCAVFAAPLFPLLLISMAALGPGLPKMLRLVLIWVTITASLPVLMAIFVSSGPVTHHPRIGWAAVTAGILGSLQIWPTNGATQRRFLVLLLFAGLLGTASMMHAAILAVAAVRTAGNAPFCIARNETPDGPPVTDWAGLRLSSLYTTRYTTKTGTPGTSMMAYHALLIVASPDGNTHFNWSPQRLRFDPITNGDFLPTPIKRACVPKTGFLSGLRLLDG